VYLFYPIPKDIFILIKRMLEKASKIYVAGHKGLVGSALVRKLTSEGYTNLVLRTSQELDLTVQADVDTFFKSENVEYVFLAAAKVGGIMANNVYRADFIYRNLMIQSNILNAAYKYGVKKLVFLGSSCIYPKESAIPIKEESLLTGPLEYTNKPYAIAKIAGIEMCQSYRKQYGCNFIALMPTNMYGPNDNYDLENSHVMPGLLRKFIEATKNDTPHINLWGTGNPMREFLHVDDFADACLYFMKTYNDEDIINIGTGQDITIRDLAYMIKEITGYSGEIRFDTEKPDGTLRKVLDTSKATQLGWTYKIKLEDGIQQTYKLIKDMF
jgi:GDP-L-fucose synthase